MIIDFHDDYLDIDLPKLESSLNPLEFEQLLAVFDREIERIKKNPNNAALCKYPPLSEERYRKRKFHSEWNPETRQKADMRLLYRLVNNEDEDILQLLGVGFRHIGRPTLYDLASLRKEEDYSQKK